MRSILKTLALAAVGGLVAAVAVLYLAGAFGVLPAEPVEADLPTIEAAP